MACWHLHESNQGRAAIGFFEHRRLQEPLDLRKRLETESVDSNVRRLTNLTQELLQRLGCLIRLE